MHEHVLVYMPKNPPYTGFSCNGNINNIGVDCIGTTF